MNLLRAFELFVLQVLAFGAASGHVLRLVLPDAAPALLRRHPYAVCTAAVFALLSLDRFWIYPNYRSPLRHLPKAQMKVGDSGFLIFESPRGASALRWMTSAPPDAPLIRLKTAFGLLCASPEALRDILNTHAYDFEKPWGVRAFLARAIGFGLILSEGPDHRKQRRILQPAFHVPRIRMLYGLMWEKTRILLERLEDDVRRSGPGADGFAVVEVGEWASRLTLDIIGPTAMGKDFQSLTHEENPIADNFLEMLRPTTDRLVFLGLHFVLPEYIVRRLPMRVNGTLNQIGAFLRDLCGAIIVEKRRDLAALKEKQAGDEKDGDGAGKLADFDILSRIMQTGEFTDQELIDQMLTFLAAGRDLRAEIQANIPASCFTPPPCLTTSPSSTPDPATTLITSDLLESLPLLHGVCEETLRLYPTVPATIREAIRDTTVAGLPIPAGTNFLLVPYAINRHPRFWGADADVMKPERWSDPDATAAVGGRRPNKTGGTNSNFSELTFLHGPRACIGRDFAKAELRCAVAGVVGKFEIDVTPHMEEPRVTGVITMKPEKGMYLRLRPLPDW